MGGGGMPHLRISPSATHKFHMYAKHSTPSPGSPTIIFFYLSSVATVFFCKSRVNPKGYGKLGSKDLLLGIFTGGRGERGRGERRKKKKGERLARLDNPLLRPLPPLPSTLP